MTTLTPPRVNVPIGWVMLGGQKTAVAIDPEWLRYLTSSLFDRSGGTVGSGTNDLETAAFDDAGIDDLKVRVSQLLDELHFQPPSIDDLKSRIEALELMPTVEAPVARPSGSIDTYTVTFFGAP